MTSTKKVNRKTSGASTTAAPRSSGGIPEKSPHWVSLDALCRGWCIGEQYATGKTGIVEKYAASQKLRARQTSYEAACWGALQDCKMYDAARNLQVMCMDQKLPMRITSGVHEIYLGFVEDVAVAMSWAAKQVAATADAIAAHRQRVNAKCARTPAKVTKAAPARAAARTAPKRRPTRG